MCDYITGGRPHHRRVVAVAIFVNHRCRNDQTRTVGSIFVEIARAVAELWVLTSGGSGLCTCDGGVWVATEIDLGGGDWTAPMARAVAK